MSAGFGARTARPHENRTGSDGQAVRTPGGHWDRLGFVASALCAVHCLLLPWLLLALPFLSGTLLADRGFERWFVGGSIFVAAACTLGGCRAHGKWWLLGLVTMGAVVLLLVHATAPPFCCARELSWSHALGATFGGSLLAGTHFFNLRFARSPAAGPAACCGTFNCPTNPL